METYNVVASRLQDKGIGRGNTALPDRRLDYVFFSRETAALMNAGPWKEKRIGNMDHDPLVADLAFKP